MQYPPKYEKSKEKRVITNLNREMRVIKHCELKLLVLVFVECFPSTRSQEENGLPALNFFLKVPLSQEQITRSLEKHSLARGTCTTMFGQSKVASPTVYGHLRTKEHWGSVEKEECGGDGWVGIIKAPIGLVKFRLVIEE